MKKDFDFYEFTGILVPGMVVITGFAILFWTDQAQFKKLADLSVGGLGLGLVIAYAAGHLVQAVGNIIEQVWWKMRGGNPTDWIRSGKHDLIASSQRELLQNRVRQMMGNNLFELNASLGVGQWYSIVRQIYAAVAAADRAKRVDVFNGNYGLCRGIASSLLVILIAFTIMNWGAWKVMLILAVLFCVAIYRMHRFGVHYGRELFVQFLQLSGPSQEGGTK